MSISLKSKTDGNGGIIEINEVDKVEITPEKISMEGIFFENGKTISVDYTVVAEKNALSCGPITIGEGVTVTVEDGGEWSIV
jgi:hypothetical protein